VYPTPSIRIPEILSDIDHVRRILLTLEIRILAIGTASQLRNYVDVA